MPAFCRLTATEGIRVSEPHQQLQQLSHQNELPQALILCDQACRRELEDPRIRDLQAQLLLQTGDYRNAIKSMERLVRLEPDNTAAWFNMGIAALKQGRMRRSRDCLSRVVEIDPRRTDAVLALAEKFKNGRNYDHAMDILRTALSSNPDDIRVNWLFGLCLQDTGQLTAGMAYFGKACRMMRCMPAKHTGVYPTRDAPGETFRNTASHKLQHDME